MELGGGSRSSGGVCCCAVFTSKNAALGLHAAADPIAASISRVQKTSASSCARVWARQQRRRRPLRAHRVGDPKHAVRAALSPRWAGWLIGYSRGGGAQGTLFFALPNGTGVL